MSNEPIEILERTLLDIVSKITQANKEIARWELFAKSATERRDKLLEAKDQVKEAINKLKSGSFLTDHGKQTKTKNNRPVSQA